MTKTELRNAIIDIVMDSMMIAERNGDSISQKYLDDICDGIYELEGDWGTDTDNLLNKVSNSLGNECSLVLKRYGSSKFGIAFLNRHNEMLFVERGDNIESLLLKFAEYSGLFTKNLTQDYN